MVKNAVDEPKLNPNPFTDYIEITTDNTINRAEIIDIQGKVVLMEEVNSNTIHLSVKDLIKGIYFLKIYQGDQVSTKRIIKSN